MCSKEYFGGQKKFREHMKLHTGELNYACEICGKRFVSANRLQYHIKNVHGEAKYGNASNRKIIIFSPPKNTMTIDQVPM